MLFGAAKRSRRWRVPIKAGIVLNWQRKPKPNTRVVLTEIDRSPRRVYERI